MADRLQLDFHGGSSWWEWSKSMIVDFPWGMMFYRFAWKGGGGVGGVVLNGLLMQTPAPMQC